MSKTFILTKVLLKTTLNSMLGTGKSKRNAYVMLGILCLSLAPMFFGLIRFIQSSFDYLAGIGQEGVILSLGVVATGMVIFFMGIFYVISTFYLSEDIENLLPLPFKPSQILAAKFCVVVVFEYLMELIFLLPIILVYGIKSSAGIVYYLYSLIVFLTLPVIPLTIASIIAMIIMRFVNIGRNKDLLKLIGSLVAIVMVVGVNLGIQRFANQMTDMDNIINILIEGNNSFVRIVSNMFPGISYAATAIVNSNNIDGLIDIVIYSAIMAISFGIFIFLGEMLYFKGVQGSNESVSKKAELSAEEMTKNTIRNSAVRTYIGKELKTLFRTPAFLLNCVIINFLWPVFMFLPLISQGGLEGIPDLGKGIIDNNLEHLVLAIGVAVALFIASGNGIASTSISREGTNYYYNKYLPISYPKQMAAKIIPGILLSAAGFVLMLGIITVFANLPLPLALLIFAIGMLGIVLNSMVGFTFDLLNPKLVWDNEQKAVKQNLNVLFHMLASAVLIGIIIFVVVKLQLSLLSTAVFSTTVLGILTFLLYKILTTKGVEIYSTIGE